MQIFLCGKLLAHLAPDDQSCVFDQSFSDWDARTAASGHNASDPLSGGTLLEDIPTTLFMILTIQSG